MCATVFNCLFGKAPIYLQDILEWNVPRTFMTYNCNDANVPRATEDPSLLVTPSELGSKTRYRYRSFSFCAPKCWNDLPFLIRSCQGKDEFKSKLKTHFFNLFTSDIAFV